MATERQNGPTATAGGDGMTTGPSLEQHNGSDAATSHPEGYNGAAPGTIKAGSSSSDPPNEKAAVAAPTEAEKAARKKKMIKWSLIAFVALLAVVAAITAPIVVTEHNNAASNSGSSGSSGGGNGNGNSSSGRPNIVFIMTDDQDQQMNSLNYMPTVKSLLQEQGTTFPKHYCTGRAAHNTNVTDLSPPYGGYPKFISQGLNSDWTPVWMQNAGYKTYYVGKLMNSHNVSNYDQPHAAGFDGNEFLLEPGTYSYWNPVFQRNQEQPVYHKNVYNTDLVTNKSLAFIDDAVATRQPFMITIAPIAPHNNVEFTPNGLNSTPPEPKPQYQNMFQDVVVPRTPNFNPDNPSGASWVATLPQQSDANVASNDQHYVKRLQALQSVDDLVSQTIAKLEAHGVIDNTYIFFTSDNGYHIGQHRLQPGKSCGYETDINIPLIVRGPGIAKNLTSQLVSSHTDLAPTFLSIAGQQPRDDFDGNIIPLTETAINNQMNNGADEHVNVEYWGNAPEEGFFNDGPHPNNTYKALRLVGPNYSFYYCVWCSGEHELYDMNADPYQMNNLYGNGNHRLMSSTTVVSDVRLRLDALLMVLKGCKGNSCRSPWVALHPSGDVHSLPTALNTKYNEFYTAQDQVKFNWCDKGYIVAAEGPQLFNTYASAELMAKRYNNPDWSELA